MKKSDSGIILLLVLFGVLFSGCAAESISQTATFPEDVHGNFSLYVNNQSPVINPVDIRIYIDGELAVSEGVCRRR